jgi:tetratricopeptide (TPR) repeat protein
MAACVSDIDLEDLVATLATTDDADGRVRILERASDPGLARAVAERLKEEADRARTHNTTLSSRWCGDIVALGTLAGLPTVVALGRMAEALTLFAQDRISESLSVFDEASSLFRTHGDEVGWARTQIGRTAPCAMLGRFAEALERAQEARAILDAAGEQMYVARMDTNLAMLLEHMNRPAEALGHSERALAAYRSADQGYYSMLVLGNHAFLLWRLGRVREALASFQEARQGYIALGATVSAARQDLHIGSAYLALGRYAEAVHALTAARRDMIAADATYLAADAGLSLAECYVRLGRFHEAIEVAADSRDRFTQCKTALESVQTLLWEAQAYTGLREQEAALRTLDEAAGMLAQDDALVSYRATLDVSRAQLLLETGRMAEAGALLAGAIPALRGAGLSVETAAAQVLWGDVLVEENRLAEASSVAGEILAVAYREGLDWLAARALHLCGLAAMRRGDGAAAGTALAAAVRHLDAMHHYIAWDDRVTFASTSIRLYADAMALAIQQGQTAVALHYAERAKARALADHLQAGIDVRPRARDTRSAALIAELQALRERYAWLGTAYGKTPTEAAPAMAVRWAAGAVHDEAERDEIRRLEQRMAEIWRELQVSNPAYRGEAAALNLPEADESNVGDENAAQRWVDALQSALGESDRVALVEYSALGDDMLLFVVRAAEVRVVRLPGACVDVRRLVPLVRLNVESCAAAARHGGAALRALGTAMRGLLRRLHSALLAPAESLLEGVTRLVVVPHGAAYHVPFHALHDGRQYLIERLEIAYAPCASLVEHFEQRHRLLAATRGAQRRGALALACSSGGMLPHVEVEAQAVVAALGGSLLSEEDATLDALRAGALDCAVLHLAAHGVFRPDEPLFSALHLQDGPLSTLDVFGLDLTCSLATLSACETALGMAGAGDELVGLSRAFLYAGTPSLVPSLWKVEDRSTAALMAVLYAALRQGASKAAALREAQLALLNNAVGAGSDWSAPFFWAPFQLIGHTGPL